MFSSNKQNNPNNLRREIDLALSQANLLISRGEYLKAEQLCLSALNQWQNASAPKSEEHKIVCTLGKCFEAQHKYQQAYELYMESLPHLKGQAYDDVYTSLLYLNERVGTFTRKEEDRLW